MLWFMQANMPATAPAFSPQHSTPFIESPHNVPPPSVPMPVMPAPLQNLLLPVNAFLLTPEPPLPMQADSTPITLDALAERIVTIKKGLEVLLDDQRSVQKDPTMCRAKLSNAGSAEVPHISKRKARRWTSTSLPENASAMYLRGSPFPQEQMPHTESMAGTSRRGLSTITQVSRQCQPT